MHPIPLPDKPERLSDEELLVRARLRDERAVRAITLRYNRRLYRLARSILRNDSEAEDVVQETYVRAFTGLDLFRGEAAFGTWLTRIAINDALGRLRRRRSTVDWESHGEDRLHAEIIQFPGSAAANDPERTMARSEIRDVLEQSIDDLPDPFRVVFVARVVEGMNVEETGELLGLRPETVKDPVASRAHAVAHHTGKAARSGAHRRVSFRRPSLRAYDGTGRAPRLRSREITGTFFLSPHPTLR